MQPPHDGSYIPPYPTAPFALGAGYDSSRPGAVLLPALAAAPPPQGFYEMQPMQQPYQAPHLMQASAYSGAYVDDSASFGARGVPLEVSGVLQFSNGSLGPHVAGVGNWQNAPPQNMPHTPPSFSTSNPPPFMRQGVASSQPSLANSSARQSQRLELPPLPRPLSSAAALAPAQPDVAEQFKPSVFYASDGVMRIAPAAPRTSAARPLDNSRAPQLAQAPPGNIFTSTPSAIPAASAPSSSSAAPPASLPDREPELVFEDDIPEMDKCMGKPKDVEVGKLYRSVTFKSRDEWIFFKVFSQEELAGRVTLNVFMNSTRPAVGSQPPFILLARELYTSGTVCPHPSKTFMRAESLNSKGEYKIYNPKHAGFPGAGVPTMQVTMKPSSATARFYVAAISTSDQAVGLPLYFDSYFDAP